MKVHRAGLYRPKEADLLDVASQAVMSPHPIDSFRRLSKTQLKSLDKLYYSPQESFHCMVNVRKNLFESLGLNSEVQKSYSLGGTKYDINEFPQINFKS